MNRFTWYLLLLVIAPIISITVTPAEKQLHLLACLWHRGKGQVTCLQWDGIWLAAPMCYLYLLIKCAVWMWAAPVNP